MSIEQLFRDLQEGKEVTHASLTQLSGLGPEESGLVSRFWAGVPVPRRLSLVDRLVELAEDNVELDFSTVFKLWLRDPDERVRQRSITGLWECEDRSLIPRLIELLQTDPSEEVRARAAMGLGQFAQLAAEGKLLERYQKRLEEALLQVLHHPQGPIEVWRRALEALAPLNTPEVQEMIRQAYEGSRPELRSSALYAMGRSADLQWFPLLVKELKSSDPATRYEAAHACGELGHEEAVGHLAPLLQDDDYQVQLAAIRACGRIGGRRARRLLRTQLPASDEGIEEAVEEALRQMDVEEDILRP